MAESAFEASAFESSLGGEGALRALGWRRRALVLLALLGCLGIFLLAHGLAAAPDLPARWRVGPAGELRLAGSPDPALQSMQGRALVALAASGGPEGPASALLLHRLPQWQVDDSRRARQLSEQRGLARALAQAGVGGELELRFDDGTRLSAPVTALGYGGLGLLFWPLAAAALLLYLVASVLLLARPRPGTVLFAGMALCQAASLLLMASEGAGALGHLALPGAGHLAWRIGLDLTTGAALVHAFALHPRRLPQARAIALATWAVLPLWAGLAGLAEAGLLGQLWWWGRGACLALGVAAGAVIDHSYRIEPHPYALVMRRFTAVGVAGLALTAVAVLVSAHTALAASVSWLAAAAWRLLVAVLLLLTPFLARSGQLLREFGLLAAVSTVATVLDLLFAALLSLGPFASLAFAVFVSLGLYAGARQWLIGRLLGRQRISTERTFDQVYRAARQVQARPERYPQLLGQLLRDLFEPLTLQPVDRVPRRARVIGG
ncbi:MAG: histidine kinase, partial [Burkholderiales bacterium]|nr:histidine kinase [Burkholderiales bacterium]